MPQEIRASDRVRVNRTTGWAALPLLIRFALWQQFVRLPIYRRYTGIQYLARRTGHSPWHIAARIARLALTGGGSIASIVETNILHIATHGETPAWLE